MASGEAHNFLKIVYGYVRQKKAILQTSLNVTKRTYCRFYSYFLARFYGCHGLFITKKSLQGICDSSN